MKTKLINVNKFTRPGIKNHKIKGLVVHWTANPGATAQNHYSYFGNGGGGRYAGAHIFVDKIESLLIVPLNEVTYHANEKKCKIPNLRATIKVSGQTQSWDANLTTIGIEMCVEKDGTIHPDTIKNTAKVTADLLKQFGLTVNDIYRHYDITSKQCPAPWVKAPAEFTRFKSNVAKQMDTQVKPPTVSEKPSSTGSSKNIGFLSILSPDLNIREDASFTAKVLKVAKKGQFYKVYSYKNGMYNIGGNSWVSAGNQYVRFFEAGEQIGVATVKSWTPSSDPLNVRSEPSLNSKVVKTLKQKTSWKVYDYNSDFICVGSNQWISRNSKYVALKFM